MAELELRGLLPVYKSSGPTSFDLVAKARRVFGLRRIGHCGTLDPFAEGLVLLALGRSCSLLRYMEDYDKRYHAVIRFGRTTETLDPEGVTIESRPLTKEAVDRLMRDDCALIRRCLDGFRGFQDQVPPLYSAIKKDGRPLYDYARKGIQVDAPAARQIEIHQIDLRDCRYDAGDPEAPLRLELDIHCSKGTYIRSLARDIGNAIGYPAYCAELLRTAVGPFRLEQALPDQILMQAAGKRAIADSGSDDRELPGLREQCRAALLPDTCALSEFPVVKFTAEEIDAFLCGKRLRLAFARMPVKICAGMDSGKIQSLRFRVSMNGEVEAIAPDFPRSADSPEGNEGQRISDYAQLAPVYGIARIASVQSDSVIMAVERMFCDREGFRKHGTQ